MHGNGKEFLERAKSKFAVRFGDVFPDGYFVAALVTCAVRPPFLMKKSVIGEGSV